MTEAPLNHPDDEALGALSLGQLSEAELAHVSAHLGDCPECCRRIDQLATDDRLLKRLQGEWSATKLVRDGTPMPADWLSFGSRTTTGNETKVVFGGQTQVHAKVRIDERASPVAVDYLNLSGSQSGRISLGIMDWVGDEAV